MIPTKTHVYRFALRRASQQHKQYLIEKDTIYTENKLTQKQINKISKQYKADIQTTYLGVLTPPKKESKLDSNYYTKEQISEQIIIWKTPLNQIKEEVENNVITKNL